MSMASASDGGLAEACNDGVRISADGARRVRMVPQIAPATPTMPAAIQVTRSTVVFPALELLVESAAMPEQI